MKKTLLIITLFITGVCYGQTYEIAEELHKNGFPKVIKTYKVSKGRLELVKGITWHKNGQKKREETYKNGQEDGKWTDWYENGQKASEETYKDGKEDGLWTSWHENGQKSSEGLSKEGKLILEYEWDHDGNLIRHLCWDEDGNRKDCY